MPGPSRESTRLSGAHDNRLVFELQGKLAVLDEENVAAFAPMRVGETGLEAEADHLRIDSDLFLFEGVSPWLPIDALKIRQPKGRHGAPIVFEPTQRG